MFDPKSTFGWELFWNDIANTMPAKKIGTKMTMHDAMIFCEPGSARNVLIGTTMLTASAANSSA